MNDATRKLLKVAEVADRLGVTTRTVYGWIAAGRLPVTRLSRRATRVRERDLNRFVADSTTHERR